MRTRRAPNRSISHPPMGSMNTVEMLNMLIASDISPRRHPNSAASGPTNTPKDAIVTATTPKACPTVAASRTSSDEAKRPVIRLARTAHTFRCTAAHCV